MHRDVGYVSHTCKDPVTFTYTVMTEVKGGKELLYEWLQNVNLWSAVFHLTTVNNSRQRLLTKWLSPIWISKRSKLCSVRHSGSCPIIQQPHNWAGTNAQVGELLVRGVKLFTCLRMVTPVLHISYIHPRCTVSRYVILCDEQCWVHLHSRLHNGS